MGLLQYSYKIFVRINFPTVNVSTTCRRELKLIQCLHNSFHVREGLKAAFLKNFLSRFPRGNKVEM